MPLAFSTWRWPATLREDVPNVPRYVKPSFDSPGVVGATREHGGRDVTSADGGGDDAPGPGGDGNGEINCEACLNEDEVSESARKTVQNRPIGSPNGGFWR